VLPLVVACVAAQVCFVAIDELNVPAAPSLLVENEGEGAVGVAVESDLNPVELASKKAELGEVKGARLQSLVPVNSPISLHTRTRRGSCQVLGGRNTEYMDRQNVWCPRNSAIQSFRFQRCHGNYFRYRATCASRHRLIGSKAHFHQTPCQHARWSRLQYLDRHHVRCPAGQALSHFHFTSSGCGWRHMRFQYWCRKADLAHWHHRDSKCQLLNHKHGEYMDRQRPSCLKNEVMQGFRLHRAGCHGNHMRFRTYCAKVLMPWQWWGWQRTRRFRAKYRMWYTKYRRERRKYQKLAMPHSPTGDRLKRKYNYMYRMYRHWVRKYHAVHYKRQSIRFRRQWKRYARMGPRYGGKASHFHRLWRRYRNHYLKLQGRLPKKPVEHYPKFLPKKPNYADSKYWNTLWTNKPDEERMASVKPVKADKNAPKAKCQGDKACEKNVHKMFDDATSTLGGLLPSDPAWNKFPKSLVEDPKSDSAKFNEAMATSTFDPLDNADLGEGLSTERRAEFDQGMFSNTGCAMGDKDCLKKAGVWPKSGKGVLKGGVNDTASAVKLMRRVDEHLGGTLPEDPDWGQYPKSLVEDRKTRQARVRRGLSIKTYDPLDNADVGMVPGDHDRSRNQYRTDMRGATGCDMGEVECFRKFRAKNYPKYPLKKGDSDDCFGKKKGECDKDKKKKGGEAAK